MFETLKILPLIVLIFLFLNSGMPWAKGPERLYEQHLQDLGAMVFDRHTGRHYFFGTRTQAQFPAASVAKLILTLHVLEQNSISRTKTIYCEGPLKHQRNPQEILCYDYHGQVNLKKALAFSCNSFFKDVIMQEDPQKILKTFRNYGWLLELPQAASLRECWNTFLGVAPATQLSMRQLAEILQKITASPQYPALREYLRYGRSEGTTRNLKKCEALQLIGKTGTKLLDPQHSLGIFAGWAPENNPRYFVVTHVQGSRGKDLPVIFGCEILSEVVQK